eukprot:TRINITY_DN18321_c0_g1_i1.p1 TRINITY_DN18321_c0_g1~~TRINITY_DN18321_c0_g1_i1.p1  ORF type:complete len:500 (+),score=114.39 TRINITY_DN18321_c0_g1_i1:35-1534(+)
MRGWLLVVAVAVACNLAVLLHMATRDCGCPDDASPAPVAAPPTTAASFAAPPVPAPPPAATKCTCAAETAELPGETRETRTCACDTADPRTRTYTRAVTTVPAPGGLRIAGFFDVYLRSGPDADAATVDADTKSLLDQLTQIAVSEAFAASDRVEVRVIGNSSATAAASALVKAALGTRATVLFMPASAPPQELSLAALWAHCSAPDRRRSVAWYARSRGSLPADPETTLLVEAATFHALGAGCLEQVLGGSAQTCGGRYVAFPYAHFSGNVFITACDYVRFLPNPRRPRDTACGFSRARISFGNTSTPCEPGFCLAAGPLRMDHWIGALADVRVSDCMGYIYERDHMMFRSHFAGYGGLDRWRDYGAACGTAPNLILEQAFFGGRLIPTVRYAAEAFHRCRALNRAADSSLYGTYAARRALSEGRPPPPTGDDWGDGSDLTYDDAVLEQPAVTAGDATAGAVAAGGWRHKGQQKEERKEEQGKGKEGKEGKETKVPAA